MFPAKFMCKTTFRKSLCYSSVLESLKSSKFFISNCSYSKSKLVRVLSPNVSQCRNFMDDSHNQVMLPALTDDYKLTRPDFFKTISNFIRCKFVIKPYMDNDFEIQDFLEGSKQALEVVSNALASEDYESISSLVNAQTLQNLRSKISTLTCEQKQLIATKKADIVVCFPYEVGIMFDDDQAHQKFVEITVVYHALRGLSRMKEAPPVSYGFREEYQRLMFVCNYRFICEFTKGVESSWTINRINHFMPMAT